MDALSTLDALRNGFPPVFNIAFSHSRLVRAQERVSSSSALFFPHSKFVCSFFAHYFVFFGFIIFSTFSSIDRCAADFVRHFAIFICFNSFGGNFRLPFTLTHGRGKMSNDEKTTVAAPVDSVQQVNNKEVEEKQMIDEQAKNTETSIDNGKSTQQVEGTTDAAAKEATPNPATPAVAPRPPKPAVHKLDFEKNVVYVYQFSRTKNIPSPSPFCLKVETWLRMAGIKYEVCSKKFLFPSHYKYIYIESVIVVDVCGSCNGTLWPPTVTLVAVH